MSRRLVTRLSLLPVLVGAVLVGCGSPDEDGRTGDRAAVEALVADLNRAIEGRDPAGWCRVFSPSSVQSTFGSIARCRQETSRVLKSGGSPEEVVIADVVFVEDSARVSFEGRAGDANVVLEDGGWYFSLDQQVDPGAGEDGAGGDEDGS